MSDVYTLLSETQVNRSVIPAECGTFYEQSLYVAEHAQIELNKLFESVGIDELAVFESTGSTIVYEGAKLDEFKTKAKKVMTDIWAAIKHAYEKILEFFETKRKEAMSKLTGLKKDVVDKVVDGEKPFAITHAFNLTAADSKDAANAALELAGDIEAEFNKVRGQEEATEKVNALKEEFASKIVKNICGVEKATTFSNEVRKQIHADFMGEEVKVDKAWLSSNFEEVVGVVVKGTTKQTIKTSYITEKKLIDSTIRQLSKVKDENMSTIKTEMSLLKDVVQTLHSLQSIKMDVCKRRYSEYLTILAKLYKLNGKEAKAEEKKDEAATESVDLAPETTQKDLIENAFNW